MTERRIDHVLFCVADQWRGDVLGALGTPGVRTPHLDALAADGVTFGNHWCQASPCGPARRTLHTGTEVSTHGQWTNDALAGHDLVTLAGAARAGGVAPVLVGYTDTPTATASGAEADPDRWRELVDPAFDVAFEFIWQHGFPSWRRRFADRHLAPPDHPFGLYAPDPTEAAAIEARGGTGLAPAWYDRADSDVTVLTDAAIAAIGEWSDDGRALLHVNWLRPHPPLTPPRPYHRLVDPDEVGLPTRPLTVEQEATRHPYFAETVPGRSMTEYLQRRCRLDAVDDRADRALRAAYYGLCAEVDDALGRLVAELRRQGRYDTTLIVFTSDHGDALGDHWIYGRRGPFDGHFRVPCIVRDPRPAADATRGTSIDAFTAGMDLFPTIADALDLQVPPTVEGRSLLDHLHGRPPVTRDHIRYAMDYADHRRRSDAAGSTAAGADRFVAVRTDRYRYVAFPDGPPLLFDLFDDPDETHNRADDPSLATVSTELAALAGSPELR